MQRALDDRMTISEAIEAVGRMVRGYPQTKDKSYVGAMAEYFTYYPRSVVMACVDPINGVVATTKYLPTPADVIGFCEKKMAPMHQELAREKRIAEQLAARDADASIPDGLKEKARAWLDRSDPVAQQLSGQKPKGPPTQEEIDALMTDARAVAAELNGGKIHLSDACKNLLREQDALRAMNTEPIDGESK